MKIMSILKSIIFGFCVVDGVCVVVVEFSFDGTELDSSFELVFSPEPSDVLSVMLEEEIGVEPSP